MIDKTVAADVRRDRLTYLSPEKLDSLYECAAQVLAAGTPGDFVEFGVALGGSGICLAKALDGQRRYLGFDVFGMIPPPSPIDGEDVNARYATIAAGASPGIGGDTYYGYIDNLYDVVKGNFAKFECDVDNKHIVLVKGLFEDTLPLQGDLAISIAHIDCDWFEPVHYCLNYVWPRLAPGGFIILDDYNDWSGCRTATIEFMAAHKSAQLVRTEPHAVIWKPA